MWIITEKDFMQINKHILLKVFARCYSRVYVILLRKLQLLCLQIAFDLYFCGIPWSQHPLLVAHSFHLLIIRSSLVLTRLTQFLQIFNRSHLLNPILFQPRQQNHLLVTIYMSEFIYLIHLTQGSCLLGFQQSL